MCRKKIKIAYFIDRLIRGGTELQLVEQINRLANNGESQVLFCLYKSEEHDDIPVQCQTVILNVRSLFSFSALKALFHARKILKEMQINIVQTYFFDSTFFGVLCGKVSRIENVISCRRDMGFWYTDKLLYFLKIINSLTDRIIVNSLAVKNNVVAVEKVKPEKIDVINNGIMLSDFKFSDEKRKNDRACLGVNGSLCIGIVGNMSRQVKRHDLFIEGARVVLAKNSDVKFFILGEGHLKTKLKDITYSYGLEERIIFLERDTPKETLLSAMDIGVLTSDSEGLSNALLEYMASGVAVVATDIPGNREVVQDGINGILFKKGSALGLAEGILMLIDDKSKRHLLAGKALESVKKMDWPEKITEMTQYYSQFS